MALLATLSTALTGKAAAALAGATLAGGGIVIAVDAARSADEARSDVEMIEISSERTELRPASVDPSLEPIDPSLEPIDPPDEAAPADDRGRSGDVHDALTGGTSEPGSDDFGQTVAHNAREGGRDLGQTVADAARSAGGRDASAEGRARADEARQSDDGSQPSGSAGSPGSDQARSQAPDVPDTPGFEAPDDVRQDSDVRQDDDVRQGGAAGEPGTADAATAPSPREQ